ncbi:MAG: TonB-dependent receptor [Acidobacteria bacterium]|nr:TonB-dependent receptor [Acidobacteriota bacterium]
MHVYVGKTGGNTYHGEGALNITTEKIQSYNIDKAQIKAGVVGGGGLEPRDTNRLSSFRDDYAQIGGYIAKDRWWFFTAYRDVENQIRQSNFPVKPFLTRLKNFTNKSTFQLTPNNQVVGYYMWMSKRQPNRLDRWRLNAVRSIHLTGVSQFDQQYHPFIYKGEYNSVLSDAMFFEIRAGGIGYQWDNYKLTNDPSYEDLSTGLVSGAARSNYSYPRRYQVLGSTSYYHPGWGGSHNMKFGWEIFRETSNTGYREGSFNDVVHILRNGAPLEVYLFGNPTNTTAGLWTVGLYVTDNWRPSGRISMNLGVRYDRYQNFLSEQSHVADRFFPETVEFPEIKNVRLYTTVAPRFGITYDVSGDGKTVIKANTGLYWENPGTNAGNPNGNWYKRYSWSDTNGNMLWDSGEEGRLIEQLGGTKTVDNDPNQKDPRTVDVSVWLERELAAGFSARAGWVRRQELMLQSTFNTNQPYDAFTIPTSVQDPGPDGRRGTSDDGGLIPAMNLESQRVGLRNQSFVTNYESWCAQSGFKGCGSNLYNTFEVGVTKRMSNRWSASASGSYKKNQVSRKPENPNSFINADDAGRDTTADYSFKLNGTLVGPLQIRFSPVYSYQAGTNFARTFVTSTGQLNYGNTTLNSELLSARRNSTVSIMNLRIDRPIPMGRYRLSPQLDLYNLLNANPLQDVTVTSGANFLRPINIVPPRVLRFGLKVDW